MIKEFLFDPKFFNIVKGMSLSTISKIVTLILGMIINLIISRYYGAETLGLLSVINSVLMITALFAVFGIHEALLKLISKFHIANKITTIKHVYLKSISIVILLGLFISSIVFTYSNNIAQFIFNDISLYSLIALASFFILAKSFTIINIEVIRALGSIKFFAFMQSLPSILILFLLLLFMFIIESNNLPIYIYLIVDILIAVVGVIYLYRWYENSFNSKPCNSISLQELFSLALPMFITSSVFILASQIDILILSKFTTLATVGIYSIDVKLALLSIFVISSFNAMVAPKFSQLHHMNQLDELKYIAKKSSILIFWLTMPIVLILIIFGEYILLIFGEDFISGYEALVILTLAHTVNALAGSNGNFLNMTGHQKKFMYIMLMSVTLNIAGNLILIPLYGINGAAIATFISVVFWNIYASIYIKNKFGYFLFDNPFKVKYFLNFGK